MIGKRGATAQSLRTLLRALGTKNDARYNLKIVDNDREDGQIASSSNQDNDKTVEDSTPETVEETSERTKNVRKELAELDDLDI